MAKNRTLFLTDYCLTPHVHIPNAGILCEEKKIIAVGGASAFSLDEPGLHVIDLTDAYATPGFIDSHIHDARHYHFSAHAHELSARQNDCVDRKTCRTG